MPTTISLSLAVLVLLPIVAVLAAVFLRLHYRLERAESRSLRAHQQTKEAWTKESRAIEAKYLAEARADKSAAQAEQELAKCARAEQEKAVLQAACEQLKAEAIEAHATRLRVQAMIGSVVQQREDLMALYKHMLTTTSAAQSIMWTEIDALCRTLGRKPSGEVLAIMKAVEALEKAPLPERTTVAELEQQVAALAAEVKGKKA